MANLYAPLQYDGQLTDNDPQVMVVMSREWLDLLRGALFRLSEPEAWVNQDEYSQAVQQASDALSRLAGTEESAMFAYEPRRVFSYGDIADLTDAQMQLTVASSAYLNGYWLAAPGLNLENVFSVQLNLSAGVYALSLLGLTGLTNGIFRWWLNGADQGASTQMDMYSNPLAYNVIKTVSLTIPYDGLHVLVCKNNGKHASSTGYNLRWCACWLKKQ